MDADRKKVVWEHLYSKVYTEKKWVFWRYIDFDVNNLSKNNQARIKTDIYFESEKESPELEFVKKYKDIFTISGDADFTIEKDEQLYSEMHKFKNFSLMPCVGGMNDAKGRKAFVKFIKILDQFYKKKDVTPLFMAIGRKYKDEEKEKINRERQKECLKDFLLLVADNVEEYCNKIYFIDADLVHKILAADKDELVVNEYWEKRERSFSCILGEDSIWLSRDIQREDD